MSRQNDWQNESVTGQVLIGPDIFSLTGPYFQPPLVFFSFPQANVICLRLQILSLVIAVWDAAAMPQPFDPLPRFRRAGSDAELFMS